MDHALRHADLYGDIFVAAERIDSWEGIGLPAGTQASLWRALDRLKDLSVPLSDVRSAESISVTMHRLGLALRLPAAEAEAETARHRRELSHLARQWLGQLPMGLSH